MSSCNLFLVVVKIFPFSLSTMSLDWGWYTEAKFTLVPIDTQNFQNCWLSKYLSLSMVISEGTPNLHMIFYQENFYIMFDVMTETTFTSIHLVKYLNAINTNFGLP